MEHASIVFRRHRGNSIFQANDGANFGGWYFPFARLREGFRAHGIELSTVDMNASRRVLFELHINVQTRRSAAPSYCYNYEHPHVRAINGSTSLLKRYRKVWTWNEALITAHGLERLAIPNDLSQTSLAPFEDRPLTVVMIAKNKEMRRASEISLYQERVRLVRGFEQVAAQDFHLYGKDWNIPPVPPGLGGRLVKLWQQWRHRRTGTQPFPSWKGTVRSKDEVLPRARFTLCYENLRGGAGYITEKLFDCLVAGSVPVYAGASDLAQYVPRDCWIDGDDFADVPSLWAALSAMTPHTYAGYQAAIARFLASPEARAFDQHTWCDTLVSGILRDLGREPEGLHPPSAHAVGAPKRPMSGG